MRAFLIIALLSALIGCTTSNQSVTDASGPAAQTSKATRLDLPTFSIEIPPGWTVLDLTKKDFEAMMTQHLKANPQLAAMMPAIKQMAAAGQLKMFAFDFGGTQGGFTDNLNVLELPVPPGTTIEKLMEASEQQLSTVQASKFKRESQEFGGQTFGVLRFDMPQKGPSGETMDLVVVQYFTVKGSGQTVVTFTSRRDSAESVSKLAHAAMRTFRAK